ncbi:MAG: hypothetical protein ACX98W_10825 [bacterium]
MKIVRALALLGLAAPLTLPVPVRAVDLLGESIRPHVAADPSAPEVTAANVASLDRFWPFRVMLREPWTPPGRDRPIEPRPAVLVRVNGDGTARLDFAQAGRYAVPIGITDLVEAAERVRRGEETKMAPNLVLTLGNKLLDARSDRIRVFHIRPDTPIDAILCVFADPESEAFAALARDLEGLADREDLEIVLFPQTSRLQDFGVGRRLRQLDFPVPFVRDRYKQPFTRSLLSDDPVPLPHVQLATLEGRLLMDGAWEAAKTLAQVEAALSRTSGTSQTPGTAEPSAPPLASALPR